VSAGTRLRPAIGLAGLAAAAVVTAALAQGAAAPMPPPASPRGYLAPGAAPDTLLILPPAPTPGGQRDLGDHAVFKATRALADQPRWSLAITDADLRQGSDMFSCAMGVKLAAAGLPAVSAIFRKAAFDTGAVTDPPKNHYARARPFTAAGADAAVCVAKTKELAANGSYPSGHASLSWTWGLILASLAPDRAGPILARARSIGESRVVCGVHYPSDIEAGRMAGTTLFVALEGDAGFRADLDRARAELAAVRAGPHEAPSNCAVQDAAAAHTPF
jgi:acid phosphatase (class A)